MSKFVKGATVLCLAACMIAFGASGAAAQRADGIQTILQVVINKADNANDEALEGAEDQRDLIRQQEELRRQQEEAEQRQAQAERDRQAALRAAAQTQVGNVALTPCPTCMITRK